MDKHEDVRDKLERVLSEMLEHGGQVLDNVYLEMMISHLSGRTGDGELSTLCMCAACK